MAQSDSQASLASDAAMSALILLLGAVLLVSGKANLDRWGRAVSDTPDTAMDALQALGTADLLGALASVSGSALVAWWLLSLACSAVAVALERGGNRHAAVARRFSPAFMRRLILAALSLQLLSGPQAYAATPPGPQWMPTTTETSAPAGHAVSRPGETPSPVEPRWQPSAPLTSPGLLSAPGVRTGFKGDESPEVRPREVTVLAGDTLWDIAKEDLGQGASDVEVALHWPRWYQANRSLIGLSPDVLLPGQVLRAPEGS